MATVPPCPIADATWDPPPAGLLPTAIVACSGGSDVGSLTHRATHALVKSGVGKLVCLASIACRDEVALATLRDAARVLVVDGCESQCVARMLQQVGVTGAVHLNLADLGFKRDGSTVDDTAIVKIAARAERLLVASCTGPQPSPGGGGTTGCC